MEGPPAAGHASPVSSAGNADPHLVCLSHLLPAGILGVFSDGFQQITLFSYTTGHSEVLNGKFESRATLKNFSVIAFYTTESWKSHLPEEKLRKKLRCRQFFSFPF